MLNIIRSTMLAVHIVIGLLLLTAVSCVTKECKKNYVEGVYHITQDKYRNIWMSIKIIEYDERDKTAITIASTYPERGMAFINKQCTLIQTVSKLNKNDFAKAADLMIVCQQKAINNTGGRISYNVAFKYKDQAFLIQGKEDFLFNAKPKVLFRSYLRDYKSKCHNHIPLVSSANHKEKSISRAPSLKEIELPVNPDEQQVKAYITKIINISSKQNSFSANDPQVLMLSKVGSKNINVLIENLDNPRLALYFRCAIDKIADASCKEQILKSLATYPALINVIIKNRWERDAKKNIFEQLQENPRNLPSQWVDTAANIATPVEYPILEQCFLQYESPAMIYPSLKKLKHFNMSKIAIKAWKQQNKIASKHRKKQLAIIAAKYGDKVALKYLINVYKTESNPDIIMQLRRFLYQVTGENLSPTQMHDWYKKNANKLVFNLTSKMYIVTKSTK